MSSKKRDKSKSFEITTDRYLELFKYFNQRMTTYKQNMITVLTWLLAFALAILGYMLKEEFFCLKKCAFKVENPLSAIIFSLAGIAICGLSFKIAMEFSRTINFNAWNVKVLKDRIISPDFLLLFEDELDKTKSLENLTWPPIGKYLTMISIVLSTFFIAIIIWAVIVLLLSGQ